MKKVFVETYGCQMNVSDSERVASSLSAQGFEIVTDEFSADIVLLNTCSVREKAEHKLYSRVGEIRHRTTKKPTIGVMGCVAQLEGETLFKKIAGVDLVVGTRAVGRVGEALANFDKSGTGVSDLGDREFDYDWTASDSQRHSPYVAFVPIIEGCNKFCTYCIVPFSRGKETSLSANDIVRQVINLKERGYREVHLIGQNVNSYRPGSEAGLEGFIGATPFSKLLRAVASTGIERIKFNTSFPRDFHPDIVDAIEENQNICNWVHLPVQSGSSNVLKKMRRGHSIESYFRKIDRIKNSTREISLTTDIIVGFPGESDADFEETVKAVEYCEYDGAYIFKYSPRPGTPAFDLDDDVDARTKTERYLRLEKVQRTSQAKRFQRYVGMRLPVLVERVSPKFSDQVTGHTSCHKVVNFSGNGDRFLGKIVDVEISEIKTNSLFGRPV